MGTSQPEWVRERSAQIDEKRALALGYGWGRQDSAGRPGEAIAGDAQAFADAYAESYRAHLATGAAMQSVQGAYQTWRESGRV